MEFEVNTGASVTVVGSRLFYQLFPDGGLMPSNNILRTYSRNIIKVIGEKIVKVQYGNQKYELPIMVVDGDRPSLLGRNWLIHIKLDWNTIFKVQSDFPVDEYPDVFLGSFEKISGFQAHFQVKNNAVPKFSRARPVPYAIREKVGAQLDEMEGQGVISKVSHSKWVTPIVCIAKKDGNERICEDYRATANKAIEVDHYPFPTTDDLFARLQGGQKFSNWIYRVHMSRWRLHQSIEKC